MEACKLLHMFERRIHSKLQVDVMVFLVNFLVVNNYVDYMNIKNQWCYDIRGLIRVTPKFIVVSTKGLL